MTSKVFFNELNRIIRSQPLPPLKIVSSENCEYSDNIYYSKNITYGFDVVSCTNCTYIYDSFHSHNCFDCDYADEAELCYESVDPFKAFNCDFVNYCARIRDSSYSHWCWNAHDLFGCVYLQNKSFCIFNRQLTEEEYREKVKLYKKWPAEKILATVEELKKRYPLTQTIEAHNVNTTYGNYMHYNKNCYLCFDAAHDEDCAYLYDSFHCKSSFDLTFGTDNELSYEVVSSSKIFNSRYVSFSQNCRDSAYLINCTNVRDSLGCVGLTHKKYCILNRQFTKEEYSRVSKQIISEIRKDNPGWESITIK